MESGDFLQIGNAVDPRERFTLLQCAARVKPVTCADFADLMARFGCGFGTTPIQLKALELCAHENSVRVAGPNNKIGYRFSLGLSSPVFTLQTS
jgi:hypothetical protein